MAQTFAGFDWDAGNREKCRKHGVSILEIEELFEGILVILRDDAHSSAGEERHLAIGKTALGRHVLIAFTFRLRRGQSVIRPISARYMHKKEIAYYEKENPSAEE